MFDNNHEVQDLLFIDGAGAHPVNGNEAAALNGNATAHFGTSAEAADFLDAYSQAVVKVAETVRRWSILASRRI
ncbi:MAG: hypothetical protein WCS37_22725 [Chloroflexota bacterium]